MSKEARGELGKFYRSAAYTSDPCLHPLTRDASPWAARLPGATMPSCYTCSTTSRTSRACPRSSSWGSSRG